MALSLVESSPGTRRGGNPAVNGRIRYLAVSSAFYNLNWLSFVSYKATGVVVNYADSALQFFTHTGNFYTSLLFGGPTGTIESLKWLPFNKPLAAGDQISPQLEDFIAKMTDSTNGAGANYLKALWEIIRCAIPSMPFPPSEYSAYANAIVGKPLALVNVGWSLELAQPPYWPQHTLPRPPDAGEDSDPLRDAAEKAMYDYSFQVKIGDTERPFDGVVAYWDTDNIKTETHQDVSASTKTEFGKIYSYTSSDVTKDVGQLIVPEVFPPLTPYFIHPEKFADRADLFSYQHTANLTVKTLLIDPYTPIHLYSGILPIQSLRLAGWTIEQALKTMSEFSPCRPDLTTNFICSGVFYRRATASTERRPQNLRRK